MPDRDEPDARPAEGEFDQQLYGAWARKQLEDPFREIVLQWKAVHLANIFRRNLTAEKVLSICEIGGAEGTVLFLTGGLLGAKAQTNYEPCRVFCQIGRQKYPDMRFLNSSFTGNAEKYDIIILSDVLEHVQDEDFLLARAGESCRFVVIKMPIEQSFSLTAMGYFLRGQVKPREMFFGPGHYNGHLRGYTVKSALATVRRHLEVMDRQVVDASFYYRGSALSAFCRAWMGLQSRMWIFGGSLFVLARGKC